MPFITNFNGNPNVGLYGFATNEYCLIGNGVKENILKKIGETLRVDVHRVSVAGTSLLGIFCAGNSSCLLVPSIAFEDETEGLSRIGIKHAIIETRFTALGNNVLANEHGCIVNPELEDEAIAQIENALKLKAKRMTIGGLNTVGSLAILNKHGCLTSYDIKKEESEQIRKLLKLKTFPSSINQGNPYVKSGLILNDFSYVVGEQSTGIEIGELDDAMGFAGLNR